MGLIKEQMQQNKETRRELAEAQRETDNRTRRTFDEVKNIQNIYSKMPLQFDEHKVSLLYSSIVGIVLDGTKRRRNGFSVTA